MTDFEKGMMAGILLTSFVGFLLDIFVKPPVLKWLARNDRKQQ